MKLEGTSVNLEFTKRISTSSLDILCCKTHHALSKKVKERFNTTVKYIYTQAKQRTKRDTGLNDRLLWRQTRP